MTACWMRTLRFTLLALCLPAVAFAQRELHWDALQVTAHLDSRGILQVVETHTMVFTGDWNGGERTFNIRPRQHLTLTGIYRDNAGRWQPLTEDANLNNVDDYAWTDGKTLRWRSRLRTDPPFNRMVLRYEIRYNLTGILVKDDDSYLLDHDFAFPDRAGPIGRFELRLTLDPLWEKTNPISDLYSENNLRPGQSFVLKIPLRFTGSAAPAALDSSRPREIWLAVLAVLGSTILIVVWFFVRERARGRFDALERQDAITESWLREHILKYPAEVVGAAWDDRVGQPEVVSLLARLTTDGTLESKPSRSDSKASMALRLKADRSKLAGYERKLVDALFFGGRTSTTTEDVKEHYKKQGFDPVGVIKKELSAKVKATFPPVDPPRKFRVETAPLFAFGLGLLAGTGYSGNMNGAALYVIGLVSLVLAALSTLPGRVFRSRVDWGPRGALLCLIPALAVAAGVAAFLWFYPGTGIVEVPTMGLLAITALAIGVVNTSVNSLKSREGRAGIAARKKLASARAYFVEQLRQRQPSLRDDWYPWILAFGLNRQIDDWSARSESGAAGPAAVATSSTSSSHSSSTWTGFGGGHSGGGGGGASWAAAASGLAAGVAAPSSSSSGGGGGGGGGGSSGGGGGVGW